jgi:hypothetical protein
MQHVIERRQKAGYGKRGHKYSPYVSGLKTNAPASPAEILWGNDGKTVQSETQGKMPFFTSRPSERISGNIHKIKDLKGAFSNAIETAEEKKKAFVFICLRSMRMKTR